MLRTLLDIRRRCAGLLRAAAAICIAACSVTPARAAAPDVGQQRLPRETPAATAALEGTVTDPAGSPVVGASVTLRDPASGKQIESTGESDGVFRVLNLAPGSYDLQVAAPGYESFERTALQFTAGEVVILDITLPFSAMAPRTASRPPREPELGAPVAPPAEIAAVPYHALPRRPDEQPGAVEVAVESLPPADEVFSPTPDRWKVAMPDTNRYGRPGEYPYVRSHWWDPFDRNKFKGDVPIFGQQTFFDVTATSDTNLDGRRLPTPTGVSTARPGSPDFFGHDGQFALGQTFRFDLELFHGDTSFRPVDWRIRVTPAVNVNYLAVEELGIVNADVRDGTTRVDAHAGLQEAFVEVKLRDLSPNYDFISVRAGIQQFTSDFRGFLFVEEQPGVRVFGTLEANRWQYNAAYFDFLEKNTNSGLNTFAWRRQQVAIANVYRQDFLRPGYTAQFSVHYSVDDATTHFDDNDFLARPAPIGAVRPHTIRATYLGWTGDGHIGPVNLTHAFYQALGTDDLNPIAGRRVTINAQMAAGEISVDRDWTRFKASVFYASGDANPRDGRARGFDSIVDDPEFAGGAFSFWDRESIRLTGAGVSLTPGDSLLPDLRTNKEEGQANFVNPGILIVNAGANFKLTPRLEGVANMNFLRFMHTEPLEDLLFQSPIRNNIGLDYSVGVEYRPPLAENIVVRGGVGAFSPMQGFRDIYAAKTLLSAFADVRFQF